MKINRTVRKILGITAVAWSIPFAQAGDVFEPENDRGHARAVRQSLDVSIETLDGDAKLTDFVRDKLAKR